MTERIHSVADDQHWRALLWYAARRAIELAEEDFYHAMATEGLDDESLKVFGRQAYERYTHDYSFDYPHYAEARFLMVYARVYRDRLRDLVNGVHRPIGALFALAEPLAGPGEIETPTPSADDERR